MGSNDQIISCHVLGCVDAMLVLGFIHAVGLLKLAVLVPGRHWIGRQKGGNIGRPRFFGATTHFLVESPI